MKQTIARVAAVVLLSGIALPAAAQNREHQQQSAELRILQEQQVQLALSMEKLAQSLIDSNKAFTARLDQMSERITKLFADQSLLIGPIGENARIMRERSQETGTRIGELTEEVRALRRDVAALLARPVMTAAPVDPLDPNAPLVPGSTSTLPVPTPAAPPSNVGLSPEQLYRTAVSEYANGQWDLAVDDYQSFIKNFPNDPRAANAQQGIGDALYSANKFEEAIAAYDLVIRNYSKSDQVAWAHYKRAVVLQRIGRNADARVSYEMAVQFGDEQVTTLAKGRLAALDRTPPAAPQKP
jgi:TolA-binding protein